MYTIEQFKIDLINMIDFLEKEVKIRKTSEEKENVSLIEFAIIPELEFLLSKANIGIIYFYDKRKTSKAMKCVLDMLEFNDIVFKKISWLNARYSSLDEYSGGEIVYEYS